MHDPVSINQHHRPTQLVASARARTGGGDFDVGYLVIRKLLQCHLIVRPAERALPTPDDLHLNEEHTFAICARQMLRSVIGQLGQRMRWQKLPLGTRRTQSAGLGTRLIAAHDECASLLVHGDRQLYGLWQSSQRLCKDGC